MSLYFSLFFLLFLSFYFQHTASVLPFPSFPLVNLLQAKPFFLDDPIRRRYDSEDMPMTSASSVAFATIESFLSGTTFSGKWLSADKTAPPGFTRLEGYTVLAFVSEYWGADDIDIHQKELNVLFYDGSYVDQEHIGFSFAYDKPSFPMDVKNAYNTSSSLVFNQIEP